MPNTYCIHCSDEIDCDSLDPGCCLLGIGLVCLGCRPEFTQLSNGNYCHVDYALECVDCSRICLDTDICVVHTRDNPIDFQFVCTDCRDEFYVQAGDAPGLWHIEFLFYCEYCDESFTNILHESDIHETGVADGMHDYDANVLNICGDYGIVSGKKVLGPCESKSLLLGVELETDTKIGNESSDIARSLYEVPDFSDYAICKYDSTCSGPEIVTLPADLVSHKTVIDWPVWCKSIVGQARGYDGADNGMHVHMNLRAISPLTLGKMLVFLNSRESIPFLELIAQRGVRSSSWAKRKPELYDKPGKSGKYPNADDDKYSILNVNNYRGTAELRMFNSTLLPERIYKNLEFCDALFNWCKAVSARKLTVNSFKDFVSKNRKQYMHLHTFIENRSEA